MKGLILVRKIGEAFTIFAGDQVIKVTLDDLRGARAGVLRIEAPKEVEILRNELLEDTHDGSTSARVIKLKQKIAAAQDGQVGSI